MVYLQKKLIFTLVLLAAFSLGALAVRVGVAVGDSAPDFKLTDLDGKEVSLRDFRGKAVVLNFWATWCPPCRAELPDFQKEHEKARDFVILTVNQQEDKKTVQSFLDKGKYTFPVLLDTKGKVGSLYKVRGIPTTYFLDKKGVIVDLTVGALTGSQLRQKIQKAIK